MNQKKIALFLPSLAGGGAERVMVTLANAFSERGYQVDLVLASKQGSYLKNVSPTVRVVDLQAGRVARSLWPLLCYLRREQPAALLSAMGHANVVAILARMLAGVKTRVLVSERGFISGEYNIARGLSARMVFHAIPLLYRLADGVCCVSRAAADDLAVFMRIDRNKIKAVYNPFDLQYIQRESQEKLDHPWFENDCPPVILAMGRLNEAKDFPTLIRAFSKLRKQKAVRLLILGEGELRSALQSLAMECGLTSDVIQFPGFVNNPYPYLLRSNLFVLSSRREGLPGALIEAMACGVPVISTNCPAGPDEILDGGRWGYLVPVGDVDALVHAMQQVLDASQLQLPDVLRRAQDFDRAQAVDAYLSLLGMDG